MLIGVCKSFGLVDFKNTPELSESTEPAISYSTCYKQYGFNVLSLFDGMSCGQIALDQFFKRQVNKIVITRPTVATEDNGFLPGSEAEKMKP